MHIPKKPPQFVEIAGSNFKLLDCHRVGIVIECAPICEQKLPPGCRLLADIKDWLTVGNGIPKFRIFSRLFDAGADDFSDWLIEDVKWEGSDQHIMSAGKTPGGKIYCAGSRF